MRKKHLKIISIVLVIMFAISLLASFLLNKDLKGVNGEHAYHGMDTFVVPGILLAFSIYYQRMNKYLRYFLFFFGLGLFFYLSAVFIIGFHNPYWGN